MWIARFGIISTGLFTFTNLTSGLSGDFPLTITLPAIPSGLSNHVLSIGPPYTSVFNLT